MPKVDVEHIISFSSECPEGPVENVLTNSKLPWKADANGRASVELQLRKASQINEVVIGNYGSGMVEVKVARSTAVPVVYTDLSAGTIRLMSKEDAMLGKNQQGVMLIQQGKLDVAASKQKWDRVKIEVTNPWNTVDRFGLTFVELMAPAEEVAKKSAMFAKFGMRKDTPSASAVGGDALKHQLFGARTNSGSAASVAKGMSSADKALARPKPSNSPGNAVHTSPSSGRVLPSYLKNAAPKGGAATRVSSPTSSSSAPTVTAAADSGLASNPKSPSPVSRPILPAAVVAPAPQQKTKRKASKNGGKGKGTKNQQHPDFVLTPKTASTASTASAAITASAASAASAAAPKSKTNATKTKTTTGSSAAAALGNVPFRKSMKGITFVLSGFVNPERGELRSKAIEMGAWYSPAWDGKATHLICAFANTPKYTEVLGKGGIIVRKEWILDQYRNKKQRSATGYLFVASDSSEEDDDDDDDGDDGDDGDVQAAMDDKSDDEYVPPGGRKQGKRGYDADDASNDDDDDAAGGNVADDATPMPKKKKAKVAPALAGVTTIDNDTAGDDDDDAYGASTEDEGDGAGVCSSAAAPLDTATRIDNAVAKLPNFLSGVTAMIYNMADAAAKKEAHRQLVICGATVEMWIGPDVTHVITDANWNADFDDSLSESPNCTFVRPSWVTECVSNNAMAPTDKHEIESS